MKILDRYVLRSFLLNYVISLFVLIGMYIVLDMVFNFDELVEPKGGDALSTFQVFAGIIDYYFFQTFLIFVHLSGVIPVVAAGFTLIRMSRFNELAAIMAAGIPLLRLATPIIIASVLLQVLLFADQEFLIPNIIPKLTRQHDQVYRDATSKGYPIQAMQDNNKGLIFAGKYTPPGKSTPATILQFDVVYHDDQFQPTGHILADRAEWDSQHGQWNLAKGRRLNGLRPADRRGVESTVTAYKSNVTPDEIELQHNGEFVNLLSRDKINQLLERRQVYGAIDLLRVKHFRLAQLVMNVIMVLVAIPCVLTREPGRLKTSILRCLVLVGLCMAGYFVAYQVAGFPPADPAWSDRWPALVAFVPIMVFGAVAAFLLDQLANKQT